MSRAEPATATGGTEGEGRQRLTREAIVAAAVAFADERGLDELSMRKLAAELGAGAMSLYNHVAGKDELVTAMVDHVVGEIELPDPDLHWKPALRACAISAHDAYVRHPWVPGRLPTAGFGPARLRYSEAVLRTLATSEMSAELAHRAYHAYEIHIGGFARTEVAFPYDATSLKPVVERFIATLDTDTFPHLLVHVGQHLDDDPDDEAVDFLFGLDLLLDGLERLEAEEVR